MGSSERWRPVVGFSAYEVSDGGRVRRGGRELKAFIDDKGRANVTLFRDGARALRRVHTLVLEAFVGPRPAGLIGCHRNGKPADNRAANLRWGTYSDNNLDAVAHGTHHEAAKTHCLRGHPFSAGNTRIRRGQRECVACIRIRRRAGASHG